MHTCMHTHTHTNACLCTHTPPPTPIHTLPLSLVTSAKIHTHTHTHTHTSLLDTDQPACPPRCSPCRADGTWGKQRPCTTQTGIRTHPQTCEPTLDHSPGLLYTKQTLPECGQCSVCVSWSSLPYVLNQVQLVLCLCLMVITSSCAKSSAVGALCLMVITCLSTKSSTVCALSVSHGHHFPMC